MKKIIYITLLFFSLISFGQNSNDKVIYLDSLGIETDSLNFKTKRIIEDFNLEKKTYTVKEYNTENKLQVSKQVNEKKFLTLHGEHIEYYPNGNKKKRLIYQNYKKIGEVKAWYSNGNLEFEGEYRVTKKEYETELFIKNFWDENGIQKVINGEGIFIEIDRETKQDTLKITGAIVKGKKDGVWRNLNSGYPIIEDIYKNGELISGKTSYTENETYTYNQIITNAEPKEGINNFRKKIATSIRLPEVETNIQVSTTAKFWVDIEGNLVDIVILKFSDPIVNEEFIRVLKKEEKWKPATFRGKAIKAKYILPIKVQIGGF